MTQIARQTRGLTTVGKGEIRRIQAVCAFRITCVHEAISIVIDIIRSHFRKCNRINKRINVIVCEVNQPIYIMVGIAHTWERINCTNERFNVCVCAKLIHTNNTDVRIACTGPTFHLVLQRCNVNVGQVDVSIAIVVCIAHTWVRNRINIRISVIIRIGLRILVENPVQHRFAPVVGHKSTRIICRDTFRARRSYSTRT